MKRIKPTQRTSSKRRVPDAESNRRTALADPRNRQLENKLLSIGGESVVWQNGEPHVQALLDRGRVFKQPVKLCGGKDHGCHQNCAMKWAENPGKYTLVTGFALSDKTWHQHSWLLDGAKLLETTIARDVYFGVALDTEESFKFWGANRPGRLTGNAKEQARQLKPSPELLAVIGDLLTRHQILMECGQPEKPRRQSSASNKDVA